MKKILIVYATAGEGHKRAAYALKDAFDVLMPPDTEVKLVDALDYTNKFFKWMYPRTYIFMVTYCPTIWGFFYYCLDFKWLYPAVRLIRRILNKTNTKAFEGFLFNFNPDIVVTTHFLASEVIANLKRQSRLNTRLITCVTDFRMHSFWFAKETDFFCVGFKETKGDLINKWKYPAEQINITGIPIHPKFYAVKNKADICNKLNLSKGIFTILITGGGFGVGPIIALVKTLSGMDAALQILVVCGHNAKLKDEIDKLPITPARHSVAPKAGGDYRLPIIIKSYGFIDYVDELMSISDVAITKSGGLICSEALAKELPLLIISPIPGQESRNCRLLLGNNCAFRINKPAQAKKIIQDVYHDSNILGTMKQNIKMIKIENPAATIVRFTYERTK